MKKELIVTFLEDAVRAPSTHNTQPWLFRVHDTSCDIMLDTKKQLPYADPRGHYARISVGMVAEGLCIAARAHGYTPTLTYSEKAHTVHVAFSKAASTPSDTTLHTALQKRYNPRGTFKNTPIAPEVLDRICAQAEHTGEHTHITCNTDLAMRHTLATLTGKGVRSAHANPSFRKEMSRWMKNSFLPGKEGIPGFTLGMPAMLSLIVPTAIRFFDMSAVLAKKSKAAVETAPLAVLLGTEIESFKTLVSVGRTALRAMLTANDAGYTTSIFVGAIESGELKHTHPVQFMFVVGTLEAPPARWTYSPRYTPQEKMLS